LIEKIKTIPENLKGKNLSQSDFLKTIKKSKINLAVEGIGQFTFRHLEIWAMGGFMLSSPSLREILTPLGAKEGVHYAVFEDLDDVVKKIKYYLEHEEEREKIARAGQEMFKRDYDARQHGDYIKNIFAGLLGAKNKKISIITKRFHTNLYYRVKALQAAGFRMSLIVWGREQSECHDIIEPFEVGFSPFFQNLNKLIERIPNKKIVKFLKHDLPFVDLEEIINYKVLWKKFKEEKPDVALVRAYPGLTFFIMALFAKIFSKKVFLFAQLNKHYGETTRKKIYLFFLKNILRVKGIITPLENILAEKDPFFIYVPFAIEAPDFAKEYFRSGRINILSIGKFVRRKDQLLLLEVVNELKNSYNLSLTLIGEEREADIFQKIKDYIKNNNLEKIVDIRTNLPYKETLAAYKDFDLFVLPSHSEPAAYSPLEAMANKLPVIVSDTCGTKCYIKKGENGYIFKSRNKED
jgi:glycosyltransferase involved in cell wall biosynthesis